MKNRCGHDFAALYGADESEPLPISGVESHAARAGFGELRAFAFCESDVCDERLACKALACVYEAVGTAVHVWVVDLCRVANENEF